MLGSYPADRELLPSVDAHCCSAYPEDRLEVKCISVFGVIAESVEYELAVVARTTHIQAEVGCFVYGVNKPFEGASEVLVGR